MSEFESTIEVLLAAASDLLQEASRLDDSPDGRWIITRIGKGDVPPEPAGEGT